MICSDRYTHTYTYKCVSALYTDINPIPTLTLQLSRGKNRAETFIFSKNAVICEQANAQGHGPPKRVLMLRIGDMRRSQVSYGGAPCSYYVVVVVAPPIGDVISTLVT